MTHWQCQFVDFLIKISTTVQFFMLFLLILSMTQACYLYPKISTQQSSKIINEISENINNAIMYKTWLKFKLLLDIYFVLLTNEKFPKNYDFHFLVKKKNLFLNLHSMFIMIVNKKCSFNKYINSQIDMFFFLFNNVFYFLFINYKLDYHVKSLLNFVFE